MILLRANVTSMAKIHNLCLQCHSTDGVQGAAGTGLQPHGNSAPKVLLDTATVPETSKWKEGDFFNIIGAGGDFQYEMGNISGNAWTATGDAAVVGLGKGHSLGMINVTPPGGDTQLTNFTCTNCHDPHGTDSDADANINKFRNLRVIPTGSGTDSAKFPTTAATYAPSSWVGGITGNCVNLGSGCTVGKYIPVKQDTGTSLGVAGGYVKSIWPIYDGTPMIGTAATDAAHSNSYPPGNGSGSSTTAAGISMWCATCHDKWHEGKTSGNYTIALPGTSGRGGMGDWNRHPVDNKLQEGACTVAGTEAGCSGAGVEIFRPADPVIPTNSYDVTKAGQVLPVASGEGSDRVFYLQVGTTDTADKIMCLSCHFAHGGPYFDNLRWDYASSVSVSGGQGDQSANPIASNKGCQLCHHR